eukprot:2222118-Amphidinium_carterae.1
MSGTAASSMHACGCSSRRQGAEPSMQRLAPRTSSLEPISFLMRQIWECCSEAWMRQPCIAPSAAL